MLTIAVQCAASNHDCLVYKDLFNNWQFKLDLDYIATGYKSGGQKNQSSGLYLPHVSIPPGSKILRAYLIHRAYDTNKIHDSFASIRLQDNPNPLPFSTLADWQARTWHVIIDTHIYHYEPWIKDTLYASRDISSLVQQGIDDPAWLEGNSMVLFWGDEYGQALTTGWDRQAYSYDGKSSEAARLEITYEPPTPPTPPPPPIPQPPPPPPQRKGWAGLDLQYEYLNNGFKLIYYTDVPCHLYCRMTTTPPRRHSLPSMRRGLRITGDIRFCFVVYEDNEQQEPGDTLIHTFLKPVWPICETRWFYFIGFVYGDPSPSESPIFKFHFPAPPPDIPPLSVTYLSTGDEDYALAPETPGSWAAARNQFDGRWFDNWTEYGWTRQTVHAVRNFIGRYTIIRQWLWFDTRDIPPFWQDVYATVKIHLYIPPGVYWWKGQAPGLPLEDGHLTSRGDIIVTSNQSPTRPVPKTPPGCTWPNCRTIAYGNQLGYETKGGTFYRQDFVDAGYTQGFYEASLNAFGKTLIKPGDYSGFCLRARADVENTGALMGYGEEDQMLFADPIQGAAYHPQIVFTT